MADQTSTTTTEVPEVVEKLGEQLVSAVKQGQSLALDAARAFAGTWPKPPARLSELPGANLLPELSAFITYGYGLAAELLAAQKDFALQLAATSISGKESE